MEGPESSPSGAGSGPSACSASTAWNTPPTARRVRSELVGVRCVYVRSGEAGIGVAQVLRPSLDRLAAVELDRRQWFAPQRARRLPSSSRAWPAPSARLSGALPYLTSAHGGPDRPDSAGSATSPMLSTKLTVVSPSAPVTRQHPGSGKTIPLGQNSNGSSPLIVVAYPPEPPRTMSPVPSRRADCTTGGPRRSLGTPSSRVTQGYLSQYVPPCGAAGSSTHRPSRPYHDDCPSKASGRSSAGEGSVTGQVPLAGMRVDVALVPSAPTHADTISAEAGSAHGVKRAPR